MTNVKLIVAIPFGDHAKGAEITDADKVREVLASSNHTNVRKVAVEQTQSPTQH